jgi:hypothetical protein
MATINITLFRYVARLNLVGMCRRFNRIFPLSRGYQVLVDYVISTIRENKMCPCNFSRITINPISTRGVNCPKRIELSRGAPAPYATMQIRNVASDSIHCLLFVKRQRKYVETYTGVHIRRQTKW